MCHPDQYMHASLVRMLCLLHVSIPFHHDFGVVAFVVFVHAQCFVVLLRLVSYLVFAADSIVRPYALAYPIVVVACVVVECLKVHCLLVSTHIALLGDARARPDVFCMIDDVR